MNGRRKRVTFPRRFALLGAVCVLAIGFVSFAPEIAVSEPTTQSASTGTQRQREGKQLIDVLGHFRMTGDRATFHPLDNPTGYLGLENLNLERVGQLVTDNNE